MKIVHSQVRFYNDKTLGKNGGNSQTDSYPDSTTIGISISLSVLVITAVLVFVITIGIKQRKQRILKELAHDYIGTDEIGVVVFTFKL